MRLPSCIIVLSLLFCGCRPQEAPPCPDLTEWHLPLKNGLGTLSIVLPLQYDTAITWVRYSDCQTCDEYKYRIQDKHLPVHPETGFFWHDPQDSVLQVTVAHSRVKERYSASAIRLDQDAYSYIHAATILVRLRVAWIDTFRSADHHLFVAYAFTDDQPQKEHTIALTVNCYTQEKGNRIGLSFTLKRNKAFADTGFFRTAVRAIKSIRIGSAPLTFQQLAGMYLVPAIGDAQLVSP